MTIAGACLATSISLSIIPVFVLARLAIPSAPAQQQPGLEVIEYDGTMAAARSRSGSSPLEQDQLYCGQLVKQGDLLFEFTPRNNEVRLALTPAALEEVEAQLRLAEVKLNNKQTCELGTWLPRWSTRVGVRALSGGGIGAALSGCIAVAENLRWGSQSLFVRRRGQRAGTCKACISDGGSRDE